MTSIMINVDLTPKALKNPTDPRTESKTMITPERPSSTCYRNHIYQQQNASDIISNKLKTRFKFAMRKEAHKEGSKKTCKFYFQQVVSL